MLTYHKLLAIIILSIISNTFLYSQSNLNFSNPKKYEIENISVKGIKHLQAAPIIKLTGLSANSNIVVPGPDISNAIDKLWKQGLFSDVNIYATSISDDKISLVIDLKERPRLGNLTIEGVNSTKQKDVSELINLRRGMQVTENTIQVAEKKVRDYFWEKGFYNAEITFIQKPDSSLFNLTNITVVIDKKERVKINDIVFSGNDNFEDSKLRRKLKDTKRKTWYNIFKRSKYIPNVYKEDKKSLIAFYKKKGYRDAKITRDTVYAYDEKFLQVEIDIEEGNKYYFGDITWVGNTKYTSKQLSKMLGIKEGDVYDEEILQEKIFGLEGVSSLYLDNGYLFFNAEPVEVNVENNTIDIEVRIFEGKQARINRIIVVGNTKTNDHVVRREIRTKPGELFSRADIIRTQRELATLGYFNPETMGVNPIPDQANGTVDIEYTLEEQSSDQIELSGGWSGNYIVGSVRLIINNFSLKNLLKKEEWKPIPSGDGQKLSLNATANPKWYQSYSFKFIEPWLGGKKPNSLSLSVFYSVRTNGQARKSDDYGDWKTKGVSVGLGRRLKWPDDYFVLNNDMSLQQYKLENYSSSGLPYILRDTALKSNSFSIGNTFSRNSVDQPIYPRSGSSFTFRVELTPPYSLFRDNSNSEALTLQERYNWIEYHKWTFKTKMYTQIVNKLVLQTKIEYGFLGSYHPDFKSPFEGFEMGGDGLTGAATTYGVETVSLRGYSSGSLTPEQGGNVYTKYSFELRYPITLNPSATIYTLAFADAGNCWSTFESFNPFDVKRSTGLGIRIFLPMMGMLGFDYAYGFDGVGQTGGWQPNFVLGQEF